MTEGRLRLLGLGARAGSLVVGTNGVRAALKREELALVVVAADVSRRTEEKVLRLARAKGIRCLSGPVAVELGRVLGRTTVQVVGVRDAHLAAGMVGETAPMSARRM
ncbi:MAG: ribosomal L7Ae/L30e/S12e/Gadd45 family protein [Gemmatimonadales bacterium]|jgi:ribosomal protein L7Ae-like RNA K-turn-binding protein